MDLSTVQRIILWISNRVRDFRIVTFGQLLEMQFSNHYEWDEACLKQPTSTFMDLADYLHRGGYHPEAMTSNYLVLYTLKGISNPLSLKDLNPAFLEMNSLIDSLQSMWLWLCFNWRYYKKPVPEFEHRMIHDVWLDMVRRNCYPPYRKRRCKRTPLFFHRSSRVCSFCNPSSHIPDIHHGLEFLYLHAWSVISKVNWGKLIALAMVQPFTMYSIPHISMHHQFVVFKLLILDTFDEDE